MHLKFDYQSPSWPALPSLPERLYVAAAEKKQHTRLPTRRQSQQTTSETPIVLSTGVRPWVVKVSSVSTTPAGFLTPIPHATAEDPLDVELQEKLLGTLHIYKSNAQQPPVTTVNRSSIDPATGRSCPGQKSQSGFDWVIYRHRPLAFH